MTRNVLVGRAGSPGVGLGRLLLRRARAERARAGRRGRGAARRPRAIRRRSGRGCWPPSTPRPPTSRRLPDRSRCVPATRSARSSRPRPCSLATPGSSVRRWRRSTSGTSADVAILDSTDEQAGQLAAVDDEYFRARAADVRDVGRRVADLLCGSRASDLWHADGSPAIIVADDLDPSAVATLRPELVAGIALGGGAPTGHAAIVARGLGIPLVLGLGGATADLTTSAVGLVDGGLGRLIVEPDDADIASAALAPDATTAVALARQRATSGSRSARTSGRSSRRRRPPGPVQPGSASSGPSCCSSGGRRRRRSPSNARPMPASGTPSRISRSSSGRSTSVATSPPRGRRAAPRRTRPSVSAASGSASIDRPCSTTS